MNQPNVLTGQPYLDYDDFQAGKKAIVYFHNEMCDLYPTYNLTLNNLILGLNSKGNKYFIDGLGLGIINSPEITDKTVMEAMKKLAFVSRGKIPENNAFLMSITSQAIDHVSYTDLGSFVAISSIKDVLKGSAVIGNKLIDAGESALDTSVSLIGSLKWMLPVIIVGGALTYVYLMPKRG